MSVPMSTTKDTTPSFSVTQQAGEIVDVFLFSVNETSYIIQSEA